MKIMSIQDKINTSFDKIKPIIDFDDLLIDQTYIENFFKEIILAKYFYFEIYIHIYHLLTYAEINTKFKVIKIYKCYSFIIDLLNDLIDQIQLKYKQCTNKQINNNWDSYKYNLLTLLLQYNLLLLLYYKKYKYNKEINIKDYKIDLGNIYNEILLEDNSLPINLYKYYYTDENIQKNTFIKIFHEFDLLYDVPNLIEYYNNDCNII